MIQLKHWFFILFVFAIFASCNDPQQLGADFFPNESFEIQLTDTSTLLVSSVIFDSIQTRQTGRLLVGFHQDVQFGAISASAYFQLELKSGTSYLLDSKTTSYDSITLVLKYDGYSYYDTSQMQTLRVHRLTEDLEIPDEDTSLYNTTRFHYEDQPVGEVHFFPRPGRGGEVEIRLSDRLGTALFDFAVNEAPEIKEADQFLDFLKGFVLVPDAAANGAILGFTATPELRLHYRNKSTLPVTNQTLVFPIGAGIYFNAIQSDRKNTPLEHLKTIETPLSSYDAQHQAYIQGGVGIAARVEMPYLRELLATSDNFLISSAVLEFYPIIAAKISNTPLPNRLSAVWVDEDNAQVGDVFTAVLRSDSEFDRDTHYELDVTTFVKTQMLLAKSNNNALLFQLQNDYLYSVQRLIMGDARHPQKMILKIYTLSI